MLDTKFCLRCRIQHKTIYCFIRQMALLSLPMFEKVFWPPWVVARVCKQFHLPSSFVQRETQLNDA